MGHGGLLILFTVILVCFGQRIVKIAPWSQQLYKARYLLLLMGIFSTFCGLIYNDFLSIPLNLFGSCYNFKTGQRVSPNCVYKVGLDPIWYISTQEILFLNSVKMKIAVIFGVAHMLLGLVQKGLNSLYFKRKNDFLHQFLPQILMLFCMFGYMDILIIKKWLTNFQGYEDQAQSIITTMVSMFLEQGKYVGRPLISGQRIVTNLLFCKYF